MSKEKLLIAAAVRTKDVAIDGATYTVRELGAAEFAEYGRLGQVDRAEATAHLLAACVLDNGAPMLTLEEARTVARSARVAIPLMQAVMQMSGYGPDEKEPGAG